MPKMLVFAYLDITSKFASEMAELAEAIFFNFYSANNRKVVTIQQAQRVGGN